MSQQTPAYTVRSYSRSVVGRSLNDIRNHHLAIDSPSLGQEITSGEAFLSGISACGVTLVQGAARDAGVPLDRLEVTIEGYRNPNEPRFDRVAMRFVLEGVSQEQAEELVGRYKDG